jgi:hypothetical protein
MALRFFRRVSMKNDLSKKILDENGKLAADSLVDRLNAIDGIRVIQKSVKINDLWAVVFDVSLPNEAGHIEFTAVQTGWGGEAFSIPNLKRS